MSSPHFLSSGFSKASFQSLANSPDSNDKLIMFKDETAGHPIQEFVGQRPKMYSSVLKKNGKEVEKETAKGIKKSLPEREIRHVDKRGCLFSKVHRCTL